jgi:hypothetical protein
MISCIRTGYQAYLVQYDELIIGDAFESAGTLILRVNARCYDGLGARTRPFRTRVQFEVEKIGQWFDRRDAGERQSSTLLAEPGDWRMLGDYDGVDFEEYAREVRARWRAEAG